MRHADTRRFYERHGFVNIEEGVDYRMLCYIGSTDARVACPPTPSTAPER